MNSNYLESGLLLVMTTESNFSNAKKLANKILSMKLASCINFTRCESMYWWEDELKEDFEIQFDSNIISYKKLLDFFWECHDPTTLNMQGPDIGSQYRSVIFYFSEEQKKIAEESKIKNQKSFNNKIVTEIKKADTFFLAENYHQRYIQKRENTA